MTLDRTVLAAFALLISLTACGRLPGGVAQDPAAASVPAVTSGTRLPKPDPDFQGKIGETLKDSTPSYPLPLKAPTGAPNVLVILLDDVGFGHTSTFGGPVPTPTLSGTTRSTPRRSVRPRARRC
jgi:arylsulfatase